MKRIFLHFFLVGVIVFSANCGDTEVFAGETKKIIAFGDSITQGFWEITSHTPGERVGGYEPDLEALTEDINNPHHVLNYGLGGENTTDSPNTPYPGGGIKRLQVEVLPNASDAEYILILEGTNDYWAGITPNATVDNLRYMITLAKSYGIQPVIGTLTPDTRPYAQGKNIPHINQLIREMAADENVLVADFYPEMIADWDTLYSGCVVLKDKGLDTVHPCRAGYEKIAQIWFETLPLPLLISPSSWLNLLLLKQ